MYQMFTSRLSTAIYVRFIYQLFSSKRLLHNLLIFLTNQTNLRWIYLKHDVCMSIERGSFDETRQMEISQRMLTWLEHVHFDHDQILSRDASGMSSSHLNSWEDEFGMI